MASGMLSRLPMDLQKRRINMKKKSLKKKIARSLKRDCTIASVTMLTLLGGQNLLQKKKIQKLEEKMKRGEPEP